jgi:hypothetical protein
VRRPGRRGGALTRPTDRGAFLDITLDFLFYASIPLAFAWPIRANALAAAVLLAAFIGTGVELPGLRGAGRAPRPAQQAYPSKGLYYLGGLTEASETLALLCADVPVAAALRGAGLRLCGAVRT